MAEVFGTAVSAISVAGFAISIAHSALKLKGLLDALKDAPNDILHLIEEIELFSEILSEIDWQHRCNAAPPRIDVAVSRNEKLGAYGADVDRRVNQVGLAWGMGGMDDVGKKCLERCQKANEILLEVADGLELEARRGGLGRVKILLGVGKVGRLRQRVEGAWRLLVLAQQIYCSALARQDSVALKRQVKNIEARLEDSPLRRRVENLEIKLVEVADSKPQMTVIETQRWQPDQKKGSNDFIATSQEVSIPLPVAAETPVASSTEPPSSSQGSSAIVERREDLAYMRVTSSKPQNSTVLLSERTSTYLDSWIANAFGSIRHRKFVCRHKAKENENGPDYDEEIHRTDFRLPKWMANVAYETCYKKAKFGWDFNLKTIHLIPRDSPAYDHIERGDIQALKEMLDRREVSPNSHTHTDWDYGVPYARESLLHWAVVHGQVEICRLLLNLGADGIGRHGLYTTPMHISACLIKEEGYDSKPSRQKEILRMLLANQEADPEAQIAPLDVRFGNPWTFAIGGPTDAVAMLNTCIYPPYLEKPLAERMPEILMMSLYAPNLAMLVSEEELDGAAFEISDDRGTTLTHSIAQSFSEQLYQDGANKDDLELTRILFSKAVATKSLNTISARGSAFNFFVRGVIMTIRRKEVEGHENTFLPVMRFKDENGALDISSIAQAWARELVGAGFSPRKLITHGKMVAKSVLLFARILAYRLSNGRGILDIKLIGFQYGPLIEDWRAYISNPWADMQADYFADFWDMVENPWESMPGAWVDGKEDLNIKIDRHWAEVLMKSTRRGSSM